MGPLHLFRFSLEQASLRAGKVTVFCVESPLLVPRQGLSTGKSCWSFVLEPAGGGFAFWVTVDSIRRMTPEELFTAALGLGRQWRVAQCRFEGEPKRLELRLEHVPGEHFECPVCKASCGIHDTIERRWRHMNFFQYRCELVAKVPRTWCRTDGVHQVPVPWAREGSGFTLMMEALVMLLSAEMPVEAMADLLDEHDTRLWRVLMHYVEQAHAKSDWSAVRRIAVDDTSSRSGRRYVTNVLDDENSRLLLMVEGRGVQALGAFAEAQVFKGISSFLFPSRI